MEKKELLGVGRTWIFTVIVFITASVLFGLDKITVDVWTNLTMVTLGAGAGKSAIVGFAKELGNKKETK